MLFFIVLGCLTTAAEAVGRTSQIRIDAMAQTTDISPLQVKFSFHPTFNVPTLEETEDFFQGCSTDRSRPR